MTLPIDPSSQPPAAAAVQRAPQGWWRRHRLLRNWLSGVASAVVVGVLSTLAVNLITPSDDPPVPASSPASDGPPFAANVLARGGDCVPYVVDADPAGLEGPLGPDARPRDKPSDDEVVAWMRKTGAAASRTRVVLTLQGTSDTTVVLQSLEVEVVERGPAAAVSEVFIIEDGCGASEEPRSFHIALDAANPRVEPRKGTDASGADIPAAGFPFSVSASDPEIFHLMAEPGGCDCTWRLRLRWTSAGRSGTTVIDDGGKPFRTSGFVESGARVLYEQVNAQYCRRDGERWCERP